MSVFFRQITPRFLWIIIRTLSINIKRTTFMKRLKFILTGVLTALSPLFVHTQSIRQNFDLGWQFSENKGNWQQVDLPHDWDIHHAPKADAPTGNDGGYYPAGYGCYKKTFTAPILKQGDALKLHFDGVYQNCEVYINGQLAGRHGRQLVPIVVKVLQSRHLGSSPHFHV